MDPTSKRPPRIVCAGHACLDYRFRVERFPPERRRQPVSDYREALGGPAAVAAQTIQRLGGQAIFWGRRGQDAAGDKLNDLLCAEGIDTSGYRPYPGARSPVCAVFTAASGERHLFPYWPPDLPDDPSALPLQSLADADALLVDIRWPAGALAAELAALAAGLRVIVDLDRNTPEALAVAAQGTHIIADEDLAESFGGVDALLKSFSANKQWAALTMGSSGVTHPRGHMPAFPVAVVDSTGAGDVFHGAFALALAEGGSEESALRFASAAGALRCQLGEVPDRRQVEDFLRQSSDSESIKMDMGR